jgi:hypothetical protein
MKNKILSLFILFTGIHIACAQLMLTGTNYFQDFNAIAGGLPIGWSIRTNATASSLGVVVGNYNAAGKTWGDTTGEFGNCASTMNNSGTNFLGGESTTIQSNCTNRALAMRQTVSFGDPGASFVLQITNTIGLSNLIFSVDLDMLRVNAYSTTWTIQYAVGNSPNLFTTLGSYSDPGVFGATRQTFYLGADASNCSSNVWIRIVALSAAAGSAGSRDTFGIDNFSLSWTTNTSSATPPFITGIAVADGKVRIDFHGDGNDDEHAFVLQTANTLSGPYADTADGITKISAGTFCATNLPDGSPKFYRIKRP